MCPMHTLPSSVASSRRAENLERTWATVRILERACVGVRGPDRILSSSREEGSWIPPSPCQSWEGMPSTFLLGSIHESIIVTSSDGDETTVGSQYQFHEIHAHAATTKSDECIE